ncbi:hypothetical protein FGO68_gene4109 [Halteria grandinella]|uniref:Transmembrane protein n=1 Tax=Halteria grandinella TaxID=5974 RepID=A0A8J8P451_HALGN|nr:hypothetical protein FGO68_gene4109 [Halteria grandinella]
MCSAMAITNFSVNYVNFQPNMPQKMKTYTVGVMFDSQLIDAQINQMKAHFVDNFIFLFLTPFITIVGIALLLEVLFIVQFSRKIFKTINDLYDKIELLNKHYRKVNKRATKKTFKGKDQYVSGETVKTLENEHTLDEMLAERRMNQFERSGSIVVKDLEQGAQVDVLQDYEGQESCMEVTKLYRAANKLIKTLSLARTSMFMGNDNTALLNYNEVANLFLEKNAAGQNHNKLGIKKKILLPLEQEHSNLIPGFIHQDTLKIEENYNAPALPGSGNLAICYNNIACIQAKKSNFTKQGLYLTQSINIANQLATQRDTKKGESNIRLAYRYFNLGYSLYRQYMDALSNTQKGNARLILINSTYLDEYSIDLIGSQAIQILTQSLEYFQLQQRVVLSKKGYTHHTSHKNRSFKDICLFLNVSARFAKNFNCSQSKLKS